MAKGLTAEQFEYLEEKIGVKSIKSIAKKLGKQPKSLEAYRKRKGIPSGREAADGISVTAFANAVGRCTESIYDWIEKLGLPVKLIPIGVTNQREMFIDITKFWPWAWRHKDFVDFSNIEPGILGQEPNWVDDIRKMDFTDWGKKGWDRPWLPEEDIKLSNLLKLYKYTYSELSNILQRSELAIQCRLYVTKNKLRPLPETRKTWTIEDNKKLLQLRREGYNLHQIGYMLGRSEIKVKAQLVRVK